MDQEINMLDKLTNSKFQTKNNTQWGDNVEHTAPGGGPLCTATWLHAYTDPYIAVIMAPAHVNYDELVLWEAEGEVGLDEGLKVGCTRLKTIKSVPLPKVTLEQRILFAIACARQVTTDEKWLAWADKWVSGEDRTRESAEAAWEAEAEAAWEAEAEAAWAAAAASAEAAAWAAAEAAEAAAWAAEEAAEAAAVAACGNLDIQLALREAGLCSTN